MQKPPYLDISVLLPPACCNFCLYPHVMTEGTKERLEKHDGPIVRLGRSSHRLTVMDMISAGVLDGASCQASVKARTDVYPANFPAYTL